MHIKTFKGSLEKSEPGIIRFRVGGNYLDGLRDYVKAAKTYDYEVTIKPWDDDSTERARNFYHKLIDIILEETHGKATKEDHQLMHEQMKTEHGINKSLKDYTRSELWNLIQKVLDQAADLEVNVSSLTGEMGEFRP